MIYLGTKEVKAEPMTRGDYNHWRSWTTPDDENEDDEGYLIEYLDGGKPNVEGYKGYMTWTPKDVFDRSYRSIEGMTFGLAIEALKKGKSVQRISWNDECKYLYLVSGSKFTVNRAPLNTLLPEGTVVNYQPHIDIHTEASKLSTWSPSMADILAEDWCIVTL